MGWVKKHKGCAHIYRHPLVENAVVDTRGFGLNAGIFWQGQEFDSVVKAKSAALASVENGESKRLDQAALSKAEGRSLSSASGQEGGE